MTRILVAVLAVGDSLGTVKMVGLDLHPMFLGVIGAVIFIYVTNLKGGDDV